MLVGRFSPFALVALALVAAATPVVAAPPWSRLAVFKQLPSDPHEMYPISADNGPWMIMAATFTGEGAEDQARRLVHELRSEFKLPAYSYQKKFDFSEPVDGKGLNPYGEAPKMRYRQDDNITEIAVIVGDYATVDDLAAQKVLKRLKHSQPKSLTTEPGKESAQSLAAIRAFQKQMKQARQSKGSDESKLGPMSGAFIVTNPLLPREYFVPKGIDRFVEQMNEGVTHSLLDVRKQYSVKVATFTGHAIIVDEKVQRAMARGEEPKSYLEEAAKSAHLLTEALRKRGYEAYEFHDRNSSIVTVGSFDSVGTRRADGKIEINPAVHKIMRTFGAETKIEPGKTPQVGQAKKIGPIPFDVQPVPVEVPRRAISTDYARAPAATTLR
ncbi:MAG: hypothetical protein AB7O59_11485 [Pirellulales bacterium]